MGRLVPDGFAHIECLWPNLLPRIDDRHSGCFIGTLAGGVAEAVGTCLGDHRRPSVLTLQQFDRRGEGLLRLPIVRPRIHFPE